MVVCCLAGWPLQDSPLCLEVLSALVSSNNGRKKGLFLFVNLLFSRAGVSVEHPVLG